MGDEARQTEERGTDVAGSFDGKKTAILDEAREVKQKAQSMMKTYLDQASDALDGFEFLTMAEAGEVGHWEILDTLNKTAAKTAVAELVEWAMPIQQRHLETVRAASLELAAEGQAGRGSRMTMRAWLWRPSRSSRPLGALVRRPVGLVGAGCDIKAAGDLLE